MPESTGTPANQERPATPGNEDDSTINIPSDSVHPSLANAPHPSQSQTYPVVVNGKQENWTLEKLTAEAQTGAAGREKFQEAAEQRKENARAAGIEEDLKAFFEDDDEDAFRRVASAYNVPKEDIEGALRGTDEDDEDGDVVNQYFNEADAAEKDGSRSRKPSSVSYGDMAPDVQRALRGVESTRMEGIINKALDNDESIAYNMEAHTPEGRVAIRSLVDEKIRGRLANYGGDFGDGTRILQEVLPEIRGLLEAFGTPGQKTQMGLGSSPGGDGTAGHPPKRPDHVSSTDGDAFEQNVLETMAYHHDKAQRGQQ